MAARHRAIALAVAVVAAALGGCRPHAAAPPAAILVIACPVRDAAVWIDDRFVAEARDVGRGVRLPAGRHRVELRHDRFHTYYGEVTLPAGARTRLVVELAERLE